MNKAVRFLKDCQTFFLATNEEDQPRVRPFGAVMEYEGKTYICTNNTKQCYKQMLKNPKVEISAYKDGKWIRICGSATRDMRKEAKEQMLHQVPSLKKMYSADDGIFEMFYLSDATVTIYSFGSEPETFKI
jgi:uncharacterized pyridoxamine 5'-phosphate oxidase family protein